jgi:hypothetical protein
MGSNIDSATALPTNTRNLIEILEASRIRRDAVRKGLSCTVHANLHKAKDRLQEGGRSGSAALPTSTYRVLRTCWLARKICIAFYHRQATAWNLVNQSFAC